MDDENRALFSNYNESTFIYDSQPDKKEKDMDETSENGVFKPTIKLLTHKSGKFHINADKYFRDRKSAMKLTQSSKYKNLKYNYGGYIPANAVKKKKDKKKVDTIVTLDEYKKFVINLKCDFIHDIIIKDSIEQKRKSDEKYYHDLLRKEIKIHDEKSQMILFKNKYKKYKYKSHEISETADGYWNPEVLEYMHALSRQKIIGNIESGGFDVNSNNKSMIIDKDDNIKENKDAKGHDESKDDKKSANSESKNNNESEDKNTVKENETSNGTPVSKENNGSKDRIATARSKSSWDEDNYDDVDDGNALPPNPCNSYVNSDDELSDAISKYFTLK